MMFTTWLCINSNFSLLHPYQDSGTLWLLRIDLVVCTGEGRCTISDIDTSSTKSLPRVHRVGVFKTKFRHCKTQVERAEFKRMLIFWWKKKSFQLQILPLRTLNVFSSDHCVKCKESRGESRHSKWRPSLKLNERHHCKIKSESLLLFPTLKWGSFVKKEGRSWRVTFDRHLWQVSIEPFLGVMKEIFLERRGGEGLLFLSPSPTPPPPPKKRLTLRQVTFVLFQRLHFHFKSKKRSLHLCSHFFFKKPNK